MKLLDFGAVDELGFAAEKSRLPDRPPDRNAVTIGPLVELLALDACGLVPIARWNDWLDLGVLRSFGDALKSCSPRWGGAKGERIGLLRSPAADRSQAELVAFCHAAQVAAEAAGFATAVARQLAACLGEMHSNILEHSSAVETGVLAYSSSANLFEFVVADQGIGVLKSLRACPDYANLRDHGEALRLAQTEGVSRHGVNAGRGLGFRPLFVGLANLAGSLRFRSGNAALVIDGANPAMIPARLFQKPLMKGFLISVTCRREVSRRARARASPYQVALELDDTAKDEAIAISS